MTASVAPSGVYRRRRNPDFEVIVVNGPSSDGTRRLLQMTTDRLRTATCGQACLGVSRNIGIDLAAGEIVAFLDDDAVPEPRWLEMLVGAYGRTTAGVGGPVFDVALKKAVWGWCTCTRLGRVDLSGDGPLAQYQGVGVDPFLYLPGANMSFRREALVQAGGFNPVLRFNYDDVEICSRLIDRGHRLDVLTDVLVRHDRARNTSRDDALRIVDPYPVVYCQAIFARQCEHSQGDSASAIRADASEMVRSVERAVGAGTYTQVECEWFRNRSQQAVTDGLSDGGEPRQWVAFRPPEHDAFRPFRS